MEDDVACFNSMMFSVFRDFRGCNVPFWGEWFGRMRGLIKRPFTRVKVFPLVLRFWRAGHVGHRIREPT